MPTPASRIQGAQADYALHTLGWKAFQDLCVAVATEVLGRPVQTFLPSRDGGRDGAFIGSWNDAVETDKRSTIQCKFTGKADGTLTLGGLSDELKKLPRLVRQGLAHDYILITNAGISGVAEAEIVKAFEQGGATRCRVLGRDWLTGEIRARPRLRMMVPRLYGLGDLSQIIDERAYVQARRILSSMGDDLACFVTTRAHRQSVDALNKHRFVLLLGDPASGKSTIGASLAVGALDDGAAGTLKITSPEAFEQHWNPDEPDQFFWIDDAFGSTQCQRSLVHDWNARLRMLRAAVKSGARVLMTSRTYIWKSAQRDLKMGDFPLFDNSQVVIDVQGLRPTERAQILYNHVKRGDQPKTVRMALKVHLPAVAENRAFLPETARRLGSGFFTKALELDEAGIRKFVEEPLPYLLDVLRGLDDPAQAAIALIFLHGTQGVPSPVMPSPELGTVLRLTGVAPPDVTRSLEALQGSLTLLVEAESGPRWTFKHPTVADAYATLVAASPEMVELYVRGAKRDRLLDEVVCGTAKLQGASVRIPRSLYPLLVERLREGDPIDHAVLSFLTYRADRPTLELFIEATPEVFRIADSLISELIWSTEAALLDRLRKYELLPEAVRLRAAARIAELTIDNADGTIFSDSPAGRLLTSDERDAIETRFRGEIVDRYVADPISWGDGVWSTDMPGHFRGLAEGLEAYRDHHDLDLGVKERLNRAIGQLEDHVAELEQEEETSESRLAAPPAPSADPVLASIFDDIDE